MLRELRNVRRYLRPPTGQSRRAFQQGVALRRFLGAILFICTALLAASSVHAAPLPPVITKSFSPSTILVNGISTLTITITNPPGSDETLLDVGVTDGLPAGVVVATSSNLAGNCNGGTVVATSGTTLVTLSGGTLPVGASCTITVDVTSATVGTYSNTTGNVSSSNGGIGNTATAPLVVIPPTQPPSIAKLFTPATIQAGSTSVLRFTITNPNPTTALTGVAFTDNLPAGVVIATPPNLTGDCNGGNVTAPAAGNTVSLTNGTIPANSNCVIMVNVTSTTGGAYPNTTGAVSSTNGGTGNTASRTLTVVEPPVIAKSFAPNPMQAGGTSVLTLTITNPANNTVAQTGVQFTDNLPAGLSIAIPNGLSSNCGGTATAVQASTTVSLTGGTIPVGGSCTITVNVTSPTANTYNNSTTVRSANGGNGNTANASLVVTGSIQPPAVAKAFAPNPLAAGATGTLTITITNPAANVFALTGVNITDNLPAGVTIASTAGVVNTCGGTATAAAGGTSISLTNGLIPVNTSCTVTVNVTATTAGSYANTTGQVSSLNGGTGGTASDTLNVTGTVTPPSIAKSFTPNPIPAGGVATLTITITNPNATVALNGVAFNDPLPAGMTIATPLTTSNTCGGTLTATAGGGVVNLSGGSIPAASTCTVTVNVTAMTANNYVNTTSTVTSINGGTGNTGSSTLTADAIAAPTIVKDFTPTSIAAGSTSALRFTISNPNASVALFGVTVSDTLPPLLVIASPPGTNNTCGGTVTITASPSVISLTGGSIPASGTCTVTVNVTSSSGGTYNNTTGPVTSTNGGAGNTGSASLDVSGSISPPVISKAFSVSTIPVTAAGVPAPATLTFTITNPNASTDLTGVTVADTFPAGLLVATTPGPGVVNTCGGTVNAVAGTGSVTLLGGTVLANQSCTITINVRASTAGVKNNQSGNVTSSNGGAGNLAAATITAVAPPTITKTFSPSAIAVNSTSEIRIRITNPPANPVPLTGVAVTDNLPLGMMIVSPPAPTNGCGGTLTAVANTRVIALTGGDIPVNTFCDIQVTVIGLGSGTHNNVTGNVSSTNGGTGGTASANLTVTGIVLPPVISKSFTPTTIPAGTNSTVTFVITNPAANIVPAVDVQVIDNLPAGLVVATPANVVGDCNGGTVTATPGSGSVSLTGGTIPAAPATNTCTITFDVFAANGGVYTNTTAPVSSSNAGPGGTGSATLVVVNPPNAVKSFNPTNIPVGGTATLTLTLNNPNIVPLIGVTFTDTLPAGLTTRPGTAATTCSGGTLTQGTTSITLTNSTIPGNGSCTVTVDVTSSVAGPYTNTIPAGGVTSTNGGPSRNPTTATLTVGTQPPTVAKQFNPASIPINGTSTLTITVSNSNAVPLTGTAFTDNLPAGVTTAGAATTTCVPGTASQTATSVSLAGATIPANGSCDVVVPVTSAASGVYPNTIPAGGVTTTNGGSNATPATSTLTVFQPPTLAKQFNPATIPSGANSTLTITVTNPNSFDMTGVAFTDNLPAGVTTMGAAATTCVGGTASQTTTSVSLANGTIPANGSCDVTVVVTSTTPGTVTNTIPAGGVTTTNAGSNTAPASSPLTVTTQVDLSLTKTLISPLPPTPVNNGDPVTFMITVTNSGPNDATGVAVTDQLPAGLTYVSDNGGGAYNNGTGVWTIGNLNAGASVSLQITATFVAPGPHMNTAEISSANEPDIDSTPNNHVPSEDDQASVTIPSGVADLSVTKGVNNPTPGVGSNVIFTVTVTNAGPDTATNVRVEEQLAAGYTYVSDNGGGAYNVTTGVWTVGTLPVGSTATLQITVTVNAVGPYTNIAQVRTSDQFDLDSTPNNNNPAEDDQASASVTAAGVTGADLFITKTDGVTNYTPGGTLTYAMKVGNRGPANVTNAAVTDNFPAAFLLPINWTCAATGAAACGAPSGTGNINTTVSINADPTGNVNFVTFTVTVNVALTATGNLTNTAVVAAPAGITDPTPGNNIASDTDTPPGAPPAPSSSPTSSAAAVPTVVQVNPVITKSADPPFAIPGEAVTWLITVTNPDSIPATNVVAQDTLPPELQILSASTTAGTASVSGQTVTLTLASLAPGQSVTVTIHTKVRENTPVPFVITNVASLTNAENMTPRTAQATVVSASQLPTTGETPWWRAPLLALLGGLVVSALGWALLKVWGKRNLNG